ncbi:MAG: glucosaminidase domain-containing protein, partial [Luteibaculum sp.]
AAQQGGDKITTEDYINQWKATAVRNMQEFGIPASIILAQGILESASGNSRLATKGNNHFGIKCHGWQGDKIYHDDDKKGECFRVYASADESFADHANFLKGKSRYAFLFDYPADDYKNWAKGLKKAGYATNPKYPQLLIAIIEKYGLHEYDKWDKKELEKLPENPKKPAKPAVKPGQNVALDNSVEERVITLDRSIDQPINRINSIVAKPGDRVAEIADDLDMAIWQIKKYNDVSENYRFEAGEIVYIQPKRRRNCELKQHQVTADESLRDISQKSGVKMKHILRLNRLESPQQIKEGMQLSLCKKVKKK